MKKSFGIKYIVKGILIIIGYLSLMFGTNADFIICDSGNINFEGTDTIEICNGGYISNDFNLAGFTGSFIDYDLGYIGTNANAEITGDIEWYNYMGNLDENIQTLFNSINKQIVIVNINPKYSNFIGYLGSNNTVEINGNIEGKNPMGFFSLNRRTIVIKTDTKYLNPTGFIGDYKPEIPIKKKKKKRPRVIEVVKDISYREFFEIIFRKYSHSSYINGRYGKGEYNIFINQLVDVIVDGHSETNLDLNERELLELHIMNSDFGSRISILTNKLIEMNSSFEGVESRKQKLYIIKHYLDGGE